MVGKFKRQIFKTYKRQTKNREIQIFLRWRLAKASAWTYECTLPGLIAVRILALAPLAGLHLVQLISLTYLTGTLECTE